LCPGAFWTSDVLRHEQHPIRTAIGPPWCSQVKRG
jgi:hypothetical protein